MSEINVNWRAIIAVLLKRFGTDYVVLTDEHSQLVPPDSGLMLEERADGLHIRLIDRATGEQLARDHSQNELKH